MAKQEGVSFNEREFEYNLHTLRQDRPVDTYVVWTIAEMVQLLREENKALKKDLEDFKFKASHKLLH